MKHEPSRWFVMRIVGVSCAAIVLAGLGFVALYLFFLWAAQSLLNDHGWQVSTWLVLGISVCLGLVTATLALWLAVRTEPGKLASLGEHVPPPRDVANTVEGIALAMGTSSPHLIVVEDECPNAAAAGSRRHAVVVLTTSLIDRLSRDELEAVLGHVLSRVDTHAVTLATTAAAATGSVLSWHDYESGGWRPRQIVTIGLGYPVLLIASALRWWALHDEAEISDLHALKIVRDPAALLRAMEALLIDESEPTIASVRNAHLWFELPRSVVADLPGPSKRLDQRLLLSTRVDAVHRALGPGFVW